MITEALGKASKWILESQNEDGGFPFPDKDSRSACWPSTEALCALCRCGIDLQHPQYVKGLAWVIEKQNDDGGWPPLRSGDSTTESTAWGLLCLILSHASSEKINDALRCLISLQDGSSGGWPRSKGGRAAATMTSMAIATLEEAIGAKDPYYPALCRGYQWMKDTELEDGGWPTLNSRGSDIAPASMFVFAAHKTKNGLGQQLVESALCWINRSGFPKHEWLRGKKLCSYETFDEVRDEWPRRKYFPVPFALAGSYCCARRILSFQEVLNYLINCQTESGRWILGSETGEEAYTWYTYVTAFALGSIPVDKRVALDKTLRNSLRSHSRKQKIYAVIIGIGQYHDERVRSLKCAENDEEAICKWFQQGVPATRLKVYRLSTRLQESIPTRSGILGMMGKISQEIERHSQNMLVFFFSGHGRRFGSKDYLLPTDFTYDAPEDTGLALRDVILKIHMIGPRRSIVLIDACRDETSKGLGSQFQRLLTGHHIPTQTCITTILSCGSGETSSELPEGTYLGYRGLGSFTLALLKSVSGLSSMNKTIPLRMVLDRLPTELERVNRIHGKSIQRPQVNVENTVMLEDTFLPALQ